MPLFDRMKSQAQQTAQQVAQKATEASKAGQAKIDELQAKRRLDGLLRDLGQLTYAERTGRAGPSDGGTIEQLVQQIQSIETERGPISAEDPDQ